MPRFPTNVTGLNLEETVKTENGRISNLNDVERGSDCEVRRATKLDIQMKSDWLLICFTFVTKSPGTVNFEEPYHRHFLNKLL